MQSHPISDLFATILQTPIGSITRTRLTRAHAESGGARRMIRIALDRDDPATAAFEAALAPLEAAALAYGAGRFAALPIERRRALRALAKLPSATRAADDRLLLLRADRRGTEIPKITGPNGRRLRLRSEPKPGARARLTIEPRAVFAAGVGAAGLVFDLRAVHLPDAAADAPADWRCSA